MAISVQVVSNFFGKPILNYYHHWIGFGFVCSGGSGEYEYRANKNGGDINLATWSGIIQSSLLPNLFGFSMQDWWWHADFPIQVRDKNNTSDIWTNSLYQLRMDNGLVNEISIGTSPVIVTTNVAVNNATIQVKTAKPNSFVRLYRSRYFTQDGVTGEFFDQYAEPAGTGISDANGLVSISVLSGAAGRLFVATAQGVDEFESLSSNFVEVGTNRKMTQPEVTVSYGAATANGRMVTVNVVGGNSNWQISKNNNGTFDISAGIAFEIPFGHQMVVLRNTTISSITTNDGLVRNFTPISVSILGGIAPSGNGSIYTHNLRTNFNASSAITTNNIGYDFEYGKKESGIFTRFNEYANHDGRLSWGMSGNNSDALSIGIIDPAQGTDTVLAIDGESVLFHPNAEIASVMRFTAKKTGTFAFNIIAKRAGRIDNPFHTPPITGLKNAVRVIKNGSVLSSTIQTQFGQTNAITQTISVVQGDIVELLVDTDGQTNAFCHVHIKGSISLTEAGIGTATRPNAPTYSGSTTGVAAGTLLSFGGLQTNDTLVIYKNGYPYSFGLPTAPTSTYGAMIKGTYSAKISRAGLLSSSATPYIVVDNDAGMCTIPTITPVSSANISVLLGGNLTISTNITNSTSQKWFKNGIEIAGETGVSFTKSNISNSDAGVYTIIAYNACGTAAQSEVSTSFTVTITSGTGEDNFDYEVDEIENTCMKTIEYGIRENLNTAIQWQSSNVFLNKTYTNPLFYIRNASNITDVSAAYQIP